MLRLAIDEDFNNHIVTGVLQRNPKIDIKRVQDVGLSGADDPSVLAWAATDDCVLFTHDVNTMTSYAYQRICAEEPPGLFAVPRNVPISDVIEDTLLIAECSLDGEYEGQVKYLPIR